MHRKFSRRDFFKFTGGALAAAAGAYWLPNHFNKALYPAEISLAYAYPPPNLYFAGTDGWISMPADSPPSASTSRTISPRTILTLISSAFATSPV